jgi:hypothetical protein
MISLPACWESCRPLSMPSAGSLGLIARVRLAYATLAGLP